MRDWRWPEVVMLWKNGAAEEGGWGRGWSSTSGSQQVRPFSGERGGCAAEMEVMLLVGVEIGVRVRVLGFLIELAGEDGESGAAGLCLWSAMAIHRRLYRGGLITELDSVSSQSEIVPDTGIFDDFQRFPPTAATVSSSLLLGICSLPDTAFRVNGAAGDVLRALLGSLVLYYPVDQYQCVSRHPLSGGLENWTSAKDFKNSGSKLEHTKYGRNSVCK